MLPLRAVPPIFISPTWTQAEAHMWRSVWEMLRPSLPPHPSTPPSPTQPESSTPRQIAMAECATEPYNPHLLGQAVKEGGEGWWRNGGMDREEKRQNDGVAIKYTTCSGERAACCWESALWLHLLIFFLPVCGTAASLFSFLSFLCLLSFVWWCFLKPLILACIRFVAVSFFCCSITVNRDALQVFGGRKESEWRGGLRGGGGGG